MTRPKSNSQVLIFMRKRQYADSGFRPTFLRQLNARVLSCSILQMGWGCASSLGKDLTLCTCVRCWLRSQITNLLLRALSKKWGQALYHCHPPATAKEQHFCGEWLCVWKVLFSDLIRWLNPELSIPLLFLLSCGRDENWHQQQSTFYLQEITLCGWTLCALIWHLQFAYLCPIYSHSGTSLLIYDAPEPPNVNMLLMWEILDVGCELDTCALLCSVRCG